MYNQRQPNYQTSGLNYQQPTSTQSQFGANQKQYQPAGQVQSYYQGAGQSVNQFPSSIGSQYQNQVGQTGQQTQFTSPQQFHSSNYRGDQAGHDSYLRSDSMNPSQTQFGISGQAGFQNAGQARIPNQYGLQGQGMVGQSNQTQFSGLNPSANQFHTANYRGNQVGHDSYLRADSMNPSQSQFGTQNQYGTQSQLGSQNVNQFSNQNQYGTQGQSQMGIQNQSAQSFHTANYQGNQPGHDNNLRADSTQPSNTQQQFGFR